jgi:hypothetical protein
MVSDRSGPVRGPGSLPWPDRCRVVAASGKMALMGLSQQALMELPNLTVAHHADARVGLNRIDDASESAQRITVIDPFALYIVASD